MAGITMEILQPARAEWGFGSPGKESVLLRRTRSPRFVATALGLLLAHEPALGFGARPGSGSPFHPKADNIIPATD